MVHPQNVRSLGVHLAMWPTIRPHGRSTISPPDIMGPFDWQNIYTYNTTLHYNLNKLNQLPNIIIQHLHNSKT